MFKNNLRPYEISLWTLQDGFITVLKAINIFNRGQIETPKSRIKSDGTQELNFTIPMYYYEDGEWVENPIWYNVINGSLIVNLRKLKLIFNKGEKGKEEIFEFVITKVTETHTDGQLKCEVTAEGLAFQELGKVGYKISLSSEDFINEYNEWAESDKTKPEPKNNLNYWCNKIFENSRWDYEVQMDWAAYDGIIVEDILVEYKEKPEDEVVQIYSGPYLNAPEAAKKQFNKERENREYPLRRLDKIYEEEYVSSWEYQGSEEGLNDKLIPSNVEPYKEKLRLVDLEKSNIYNLTQNLAETFGVFCKYKYEYDDNYHIIGKKCIFYNNFISEKEGKIDIIYPYSTSKIEREIDSSDIVTKMFVTAVESDSSPSGLITIADVAANKSREDYILNFDYLYSIGTISQEQYDAIADYERSMYLINTELEPIASQIANLQTELVKYQAQKTIAEESIRLDNEQIEQSQKLLEAITEGTSNLYRNLDRPYKSFLLDMGSKEKINSENEIEMIPIYYMKLTIEGISDLKEDGWGYPLHSGDTENTYGIRLWYKQNIEGSQETEYEEETSFSVKYDSNGNIIALEDIELSEKSTSKFYYATFLYKPSLHYENIQKTFANKLLEDEVLEKEAAKKIIEIEEKIKKLEEKYSSLLEQKKIFISDFENMMGPALKEGSWQADNYDDYGNKYNQSVVMDTSNNSHINFYWDSVPFEEEQKLYYETFGNEGESIQRNYYPCISLKDHLSEIKDYLDKLSFIYNNKQEQMTIGSEMVYAFIGEEKTPVLLLTKENFILSNEIKADCFLGIISSIIEQGEIKTQVEEKIKNAELTWINLDSTSIIYYPRLKVESLLLKTSDDELVIKLDEKVLQNYYDYYILSRGDNYYITLKDKILLQDGNLQKTFDVSYSLSNAALSLYLDALEVSKTNATPQVSYTLEVSAMNKEFIEIAYKNLNKIVSINDSDLKFEDVQGYISELDLDLDNPWEDSITIQNYKTKFEDLFSTIVASTEQMKTNSFAYNNAASAFGPGGTLKPTIIQNTINQTDLTYAFQNGNLTIDEANGIWARSDSGVVAMRGGGIFCATQKDGNGNWIWNTGILPSGINASLITAGQLDTNLIKVYAGDNLRLQLNGEGLFAYRPDALGEADLNQYIVHNSEGLFSTIKTGNSEVNLVEVSWNGFILRKENGDVVFNADRTGNLSIVGTVTAAAGNIGNWEIKDTGLWYKDGTAGLTTGSGVVYDKEGHPLNGEEKMFWVTGTSNQDGTYNEFVVTKDGTMYCSDVIVRGTVSAGSFVGNTLVGEIDQQLRNISIAVLDGTTFFYENRNYDGILLKSPEQLKFRIYTNALTREELTAYGKDASKPSNALEDYIFYYGISETTEENAVWTKIEPDEYGTYENLIWESNYLTFRLKNDIMYKGLKEDQIGPQSLLYFKVEKKGTQRIVNSSGEVEYKGVILEEDIKDTEGNIITPAGTEVPYIYQDSILLNSETFGIGKFASAMDPPSYSFIKDENKEIDFKDNITFSVKLTGFDPIKDKEELEKSYWSIDGLETKLAEKLQASLTKDNQIDEVGYAALISNSDSIIIEGEEIGEPEYNENGVLISPLIDGRAKNSYEGITISLVAQSDGSFIASATISNSIVPEGGNIVLTYHIGYATRSANCFKIKNGSDGINVIMRSSSGMSLMSGDTETELTTEVFYGTQLMNDEDSKTQFFYVWKKDGVALSNIQVSSVELIDNLDENDPVKTRTITKLAAKKENGKGNEDFFKQKNIYITAADFESKAIYRCDVFSKLKKENKEDLNEAVDDYLLMNEAGHTELIFE